MATISRDDVIRIISNAGLPPPLCVSRDGIVSDRIDLVEFAALVAAAEREKHDAQVKALGEAITRQHDGPFEGDKTGPECAADIRAQGKPIDLDALEHDMRQYGPSACADGETVLALIKRIRAAEKGHALLLTAAKEAADQIRRCDYMPARSTLLRAITDAEARHG